MGHRLPLVIVAAVVSLGSWGAAGAQGPGAAMGLFTSHGDVGVPSTIGAGEATYDTATKTYTISGGGENMWANADHFHYVWKKMSGDVALTATIRFVGTTPDTGTPDPHRKACLVIRQTLDSDAVYADAAAHGNGLTSLQWRDAKGAVTHEVQTDIDGPTQVRIEKRGNYVSMSVAGPGEALHPAGGAARVDFTGDFYVGLAVSAHNTGRIEKVEFSNVALIALPRLPTSSAQTTLINTLQTISLRSRDRRVAYVTTQPDRLEAPNWFPDATNTLYFNNGGRFYKVQAEPPGTPPNPTRLKVPETIGLGTLTRINSGHGVSPDGKLWAFSDQSAVYTMPVGGAAPKRVTASGPSYFHGWSPDSKTLAYSAERKGNLDVYTVAVDGGEEQRLTTASGKDDGPEFSPDGQYIYFSSDRTGLMQVWRMKVDGSAQEQVTKDDAENWCPHISPNGQSMVFLTYDKGAGGHLQNTDVALRLMNLATGAVDVLAKLFGGQGTIDVPSWSPNSQYLAFVSYQIVPK
jgi:TolB protein